MPDLSRAASHEFWHGFRDTSVYKVVSFMECVEDWTLDDDPKLEAALINLGDTLEDIGGIDLKEQDNFIKIATYIKASRMLRLMQSLDSAYPGAASKLLMHAEETTTSNDDVPGLFLKRNIVFERLRLLGRVFAPERLSLVLKALEDDSNE